MSIASIASVSALAAGSIGALPYTSVVRPTTTSTLVASSVPRVMVPPTPPRYMTGPGIQVSGYPALPAEYDFPFEQTKINTTTGLLTRTAGTPLPPIPNLVKYSDGLWYQAPTNSWEYVSSPLQPYNAASGPYAGKTPTRWAMLTDENAVDLSTGEIFNNPYTPVPQMEVAFENGKAYAAPRDPFQFMESPFQPYNLPTPFGTKPTANQIPPMTVAGTIGLKQGYNPATMDILTGVQGLPLNYHYNLNTPAIEPEQQIGVIGMPGVPVV